MENILSNQTEEYTAPRVGQEGGIGCSARRLLSKIALNDQLNNANDFDNKEQTDPLLNHDSTQDLEPIHEIQGPIPINPNIGLDSENIEESPKMPGIYPVYNTEKKQCKPNRNKKTVLVSERLNSDAAGSKRSGRVGIDAIRLYLDEIGRFELLNAEDEVRLAGEIKQARQAQRRLDNTEDKYKSSLVTADLELIERGKIAKQEFVQANLRLVVNVAKRFKQKAGYGLEFMDLIQAGYFGLEHAVDKFDAEKGFKFSTYAVNWIQQSIRREINRHSNIIRIKSQKIDEDIFTLKKELGRGLNLVQILHEHPLWSEEYINTLHKYNIIATPTSSDRTIGDDEETTLGDMLSDKHDDYIAKDNEILKTNFIDTINSILTDKEQKIIWLRFGLGPTGDVLSFVEIGEQLGITQQAVQQFYKKVLKKLQSPSNKKIIGHYADLLLDDD